MPGLAALHDAMAVQLVLWKLMPTIFLIQMTDQHNMQVTPLHTDPKHNLLAQVVGRKYVRLYRPCDTPQLRPFDQGLTTNSSQIDLDRAADWQAIQHIKFWECLLHEGQMLYIPPKWMHYVKAVSVSFSCSFWWQ